MMTIKSKISFYISIIFTILFGIICFLVITIFSNFRKQEFKERLNEKATNTIKLLVDIPDIDPQKLKSIEQKFISKLYNEKTLVFDSKYNLIYSSQYDTKVDWTIADLEYLKKHKTFFKKDGENEIYGVFYDNHHEDYFALISANDNYGNRKLDFLIMLLLGAYILFTILTWILSFLIVKKQINPINQFHQKISQINELNIESPLEIAPNSKNEISLISNEFNYMMHRINNAYQKQKEFTSQASHELRTPLARISARLENQLGKVDKTMSPFLQELFLDINQLKELINSLLLLSTIDSKTNHITEFARIDEAIFNSIDHVNKQFPDLKINLNINIDKNKETLLEVKGNQSLLEIAFSNLIKNAYLYSDNHTVQIDLIEQDQRLSCQISNNGKTLVHTESQKLYQAFMRGQNAGKVQGHGLGLRIVHRILTVYNFSIQYSIENNLNTFTIKF